MGLDQTLNWIGKPSRDMVKRLHHKNLSELDYPIGMNYADLEDAYNQKIYDEIKKYMISEEVYLNECDWNMIRDECGMPHDANICGIGHNTVTFGKAMNVGEPKTFNIKSWDKKYWKPVLHTVHFWLEDELYRWRNAYDIQDIFNESHPDDWCEHRQKYEMYNCGVYKLKKSELNKIIKIDPVFAAKWQDGTDHIYYSANW